MTHERDAQVIVERLGSVPGILNMETNIRHQRVTMIYDVTCLNYKAVLQALENSGFPTSDNWTSRMKTNWFQYLDENRRQNTNAPMAPCCGNPKGISPKKRRRPELSKKF